MYMYIVHIYIYISLSLSLSRHFQAFQVFFCVGSLGDWRPGCLCRRSQAGFTPRLWDGLELARGQKGPENMWLDELDGLKPSG